MRFSLPASIARLDVGAAVFEIEALFRRHGARTQAQPTDVTFAIARGGLRAAASFVLESDRIARAVVTHVRVAPFIEGIAIVVHPHAAIDAPILVADVMVVPSGFTRAYLDTCGPSITRADFAARFKNPLSAIVDDAPNVSRTIVPSWIAPLSGGAGARLRARPRNGDAAARTAIAYLHRYLIALDSAPRAPDARANQVATDAVADTFRQHGMAGKRLARAFGKDFAARYIDLLWE